MADHLGTSCPRIETVQPACGDAGASAALVGIAFRTTPLLSLALRSRPGLEGESLLPGAEQQRKVRSLRWV
jgi:hypothetical protein